MNYRIANNIAAVVVMLMLLSTLIIESRFWSSMVAIAAVGVMYTMLMINNKDSD